jgi:hypothetical protein
MDKESQFFDIDLSKIKQQEDVVRYYISKKSDILLGIHPMNKEKILKYINILPSGMFIDFGKHHYQIPYKVWVLLGVTLCENNNEELYKIFINEIRPYILKNGGK